MLKSSFLNKDFSHSPHAVILFQRKRSLRCFRKGFLWRSETFSQGCSPVTDLTRAIYEIYDMAIANTLVFLREWSHEVDNLVGFLLFRAQRLYLILTKVFKGRAFPSKEKILHLMHMNDCTTRAGMDMVNNRNLLDEHVECLDQFDPDSPDHATRDEALDKRQTNLDYLKTELNNIAKKIKDVKSEVRGA